MGRLTAVGFDWVYRRSICRWPSRSTHTWPSRPSEVLEVARQYDLTATTSRWAWGPLEVV